MWEIIESNKRKSKIIFFLLVVVFLLTGVFYGVLVSSALVLIGLQSGSEITMEQYISLTIVCAVVCTLGAVLFALFKRARGARSIVEDLGAVEVSARDHDLNNIVEEMAIASGLAHFPKLYILDDEIPNAFAIGFDQKNARIVVTSKLVKILDRQELQGVIAHETAHIKNFDSKLMTNAYMMLYLIYAFSGRFIHSGLMSDDNAEYRTTPRIYIPGGGRGGGKGGGAIVLIALAALIISLIYIYIIAPILTQILYSMLSKRREYLADACAVQFTRYPAGLAGALDKINNDDSPESMIGSNNLELFNTLAINPSFSNNIQTHPPIETRIAVLNRMAGSGLADYNTAYSRTTGKSITKDTRGFTSQDIVAAAVTGAVALSTLEKHRMVGEVFEKEAKYIEINCDCGTKLKIPPEYIGQKLCCPQCGKEYEIKEDIKNEMSKV